MTITKDIVDNAISSDSELSALGRSATFIPVYGNDVTEIGDEAFVSCNSITAFKFPAELQKIGSKSFAECSSLVSVDMSYASVSALGTDSFAKCYCMQSVCLPNGQSISVGPYAFWDCSSLTAVSTDSQLCLCRSAFAYCRSLVDTKSMPNVKSIGYMCFDGYGILSGIFDNCEYVDTYAFGGHIDSALRHVSFKSLLTANG